MDLSWLKVGPPESEEDWSLGEVITEGFPNVNRLHISAFLSLSSPMSFPGGIFNFFSQGSETKLNGYTASQSELSTKTLMLIIHKRALFILL